jgi:hypothetical protein
MGQMKQTIVYAYNSTTNITTPIHGPRILLGIFVNSVQDSALVERHLQILQHDPRACPLSSTSIIAASDTSSIVTTTALPSSCKLVYTFVTGIQNFTTGTPTKLLNLTSAKDFVLPSDSDYMTRLNIRESTMSDKSQTWFFYASHLLQSYNIDYVAKSDATSFLKLDDYFYFAYFHLPIQTPRRIFVGMFQHPTNGSPANPLFPSYVKTTNVNYLNTRYQSDAPLWYAVGQFYVFSAAMVKEIVIELPNYPNTAHDYEDFAMSMVAFMVKPLVEMICLAETEVFWTNDQNNFSQEIMSSQTSMTNAIESNLSSNRPTRILMGIFTMGNSYVDLEYRTLFRRLFRANHPFKNAICSLSNVTDDCEFIYSFVVGANPEASSQFINGSSDRDYIFVDRTATLIDLPDAFEGDFTKLNIRENMDLGKSPTWFSYASHLSDPLGIDYIGKLDTDTILKLDGILGFVRTHLPAKTERRIIAGLFADSSNYQRWLPTGHYDSQRQYLESKFGKYRIHAYAQGQFYLFSARLVHDVIREELPYFPVNFEDQIMSFVCLKSSGPVEFLLMAKPHVPWIHGIKLNKRHNLYMKVWEEERDRLMRGNLTEKAPFAVDNTQAHLLFPGPQGKLVT